MSNLRGHIAIVGSSKADYNPFVDTMYDAIEGAECIHVRGSAVSGTTGNIDSFVERLGLVLKRHVVVFRPMGPKREDNYVRDNELVRSVERVIAFYHPEMVGLGGTGHVVEAALRLGLPTVAYTLDDKGNIMEVGSDDGDQF